MKKIKCVLVFVISILLTNAFSIYATVYYEASQINYKNTTLDHAIDDLYTTQNTTVSNLESTVDSLNSRNFKMGGVYTKSLENSTSIELDLEKDYYYFCSLTTRGNTASLSISNANVLFNGDNNWFLDNRYSSAYVFIRANQNKVTFSFNNVDLSYNPGSTNGIGVKCKKITYSN